MHLRHGNVLILLDLGAVTEILILGDKHKNTTPAYTGD